MNKLAKRAWFALALAGVLLVGLLVIVVRYFKDSPDWVTFQNNPHVYNNGVMDSGTVVDRDGTVLLDATDGRSYADSETLRKAMLHLLGDTEGNITPYLLNEYGDELIGFDRINGTHHTGSGSGELRMTLSADVQRTALNALNGQKGAVGVYNYKTGEVLCMVSSPTFDPLNVPDVNADPERYDGVYVNRFLHATYAPGSTFKLVTSAAALSEMDDLQTRTFHCEGSAQIGSETVICNGVHGDVTFEQALAQSCNVAFAQLAQELGPEVLTRYVARIGITDSIAFDGLTTKRGHFDLSDATTYEAAWAGVGQYTDQINPCQFMVYMGAIANGGEAALPHLVESVTFGGKEKYSAETEMTDRILSRQTADALAEAMHYAVVTNYGEWNFGGLYAGAKSGTAERGEGQAADALFAGFVQDPDYPLAFFVVVEGGGSGSAACTPIVQQVLNACIAAMQ
ncbi:MAG: penicillin-binding transpeptidase domain-containing protein [Firmicutes bacterium]|nr:penicillin-binding transpeptidase domain-containing protein [Bacillota bacterium]